MGLIDNYVEVGIGGKNIKHYRDLGYDIPMTFDKYRGYNAKMGAKIMVKASHLTRGSSVFVDVECDGCKELLKVKYNDYNRHNHNGKYYCQPCYARLFMSGKNSPSYNHNKTDKERENGRNIPEYTDFIKRVLARDNYICQCCGQKQGDLEVHHLDGYNWCIEKRTDDTNGITLCHNCHSNFHVLYGHGNNTKEQFEEWFGRTIELVKCGIEIVPSKKVYCIETNTIYDSVDLLCSELKIKYTSRVYDICNKLPKAKSYNGYHFLWYDEYITMSQKDVENYLQYCSFKQYKKVICIETQKVFDNAIIASRIYNPTSDGSAIIKACRNYTTTYSLEDGTSLHWMYYDEYLDKIDKGIEITLKPNNHNKSIVCTTTGEIFKKIILGAKRYGITDSSISKVCRKLQESTKLSDGTPLQWMYYKDFLKLPIEEQNEILERNKDSSNDGSFINDKNNKESEENN